MISRYGSANDFNKFLVGKSRKTFASLTNYRLESPAHLLPLLVAFLPGFLKMQPVSERRNKLLLFLVFFRSLLDGHMKYGQHVRPAMQMYEIPITFAIGLLFTLPDRQLAPAMTG